MKAQFVRDDIEISLPVPPGHEDQWEYREVRRNGKMVNVPFWKNGATIEHPDAHALVSMGCAVPADDECHQAANMTPLQIRAAIKAQDKVSKGIHPDDYAKFDNGEILGYNPDGSYIPGPNFKAEAPVAEVDDEEDDK